MPRAHFFGAPPGRGPEAAAPGEDRLWVGSGQVSAGPKVNKIQQEAGALDFSPPSSLTGERALKAG